MNDVENLIPIEIGQNSEEVIIACLVNDKSSRPEILTRLNVDQFSNPQLRAMFYLINQMTEEGIDVDLASLNEKIINSEYEDIPSIINYLNNITTQYSSIDNISNHIKYVLNVSTKRKIDEFCNEIIKSNIDVFNADSQFENYQEKLDMIINSRNIDDIHEISAYVSDFRQKLENIKKNNGKLTGTTSGYREIDDITNGFQAGDLIILAARPSLGKTALAINFIINSEKELVKENNECVVMFSLEMGVEQIIQRIICNECRIDGDVFLSGKWDENTEIIIHSKLNNFNNMNFFIDDNPSTKIIDIQSKLLQISKKYKIKLVVVDYLQLIESSIKGLNRSLEVGKISRKLKIMARELNVPIIAVAQLSRKIEDRKESDRKPMLSDLRESGSIEQDADIVMFLDYPRNEIDESKKDKNIRQYKSIVNVSLYIEKNRNGRTGVVSLGFDKKTGKYSSIKGN